MAADLLSDFFEQNGWDIEERLEIESGTLLFLGRSGEENTGLITIGPGRPEGTGTVILAMIYR